MRTIEMLVTVEDSHSYAVEHNGEVQVLSDVRYFYEKQRYNGDGIPGDWDRRCTNLVSLDYAKDV